ncbi:MAG: hypothetical protein AAB408_04800, partial [Patescibacteria group bacterium]
MADRPGDGTIVVKKFDGTMVRMTMAEFRAYQKALQHPSTPAMPTGRQAPKHSSTTMSKVIKKIEPEKKQVPEWTDEDHKSLLDDAFHKDAPMSHALSTTSPVTKIFVDEAQAKQIPNSKSQIPNPSVAEVLKRVGWQVNADVRKRLESLILSCLKDVRNDEQFLSTAMAPIDKGGAGLSREQAERLLAVTKEFLSKQTSAIRLQQPTMSDQRLKEKSGQSSSKQQSQEFDQKLKINDQEIGGSKFQIQNSKFRSTMHDITPPQEDHPALGPREEFAGFSLVDFVRLAPTTDARLSRLKEKFATWRQESFLVFLDVKEAWRKSSLYRMYIDTILASLKEKKPIAE